MLTALTRAVSRSLAACELTWLARQKIDIALAIAQHDSYERALTEMGVQVISLPEEPDLPDAVFVEDPMLVFDELAILTQMGAASRRLESESLTRAIAPFRPLRHLLEPATLEGGDVIRIDKDVFVGLSSRTNAVGIEQLASELKPFGYQVRPVEVRGCLHLKSACCSLGGGAILANRAWFDSTVLDSTALGDYRMVDVADGEPGAANVLRIGNTVLMPDCFPRTRALIEAEGLSVRTVDISELMKAEAAVTCSSIIFESARPNDAIGSEAFYGQ
jgi:dimethylargininase